MKLLSCGCHIWRVAAGDLAVIPPTHPAGLAPLCSSRFTTADAALGRSRRGGDDRPARSLGGQRESARRIRHPGVPARGAPEASASSGHGGAGRTPVPGPARVRGAGGGGLPPAPFASRRDRLISSHRSAATTPPEKRLRYLSDRTMLHRVWRVRGQSVSDVPTACHHRDMSWLMPSGGQGGSRTARGLPMR